VHNAVFILCLLNEVAVVDAEVSHNNLPVKGSDSWHTGRYWRSWETGGIL